MEAIYKHNFFAKKKLSYYEARGILLKQGYRFLRASENWKETGNARVTFTNGCEYADLYTKVIKNEVSGKWSCQKVYYIQEWTEAD